MTKPQDAETPTLAENIATIIRDEAVDMDEATARARVKDAIENFLAGYVPSPTFTATQGQNGEDGSRTVNISFAADSPMGRLLADLTNKGKDHE